MNRLTKKNQDDNFYYSNTQNHNYDNVNLIQKLGKLEDREEQLGCLLEIIFKATENGIIDHKGRVHDVLYGGYYLFSMEDDEIKCAFYLKNYQKTWWLKGEKTNE